MKINIAVLFGGKSVEHEVSVISAIQAMRSLNVDKYDIFPVYITKGNEFYYGEELRDIEEYKNIPALLKKAAKVAFVTEGDRTYLEYRVKKGLFKSKRVAQIDLAFPIVHGTNVEDGTLQGYIKTLNMPFVGCGVLASALCMDKFSTKVLLKHAGLPVLDCLRFTSKDQGGAGGMVKAVEGRFPYPVIVKPVNLGSSVGIARAGNAAELAEALEGAFLFADKAIVEPAVANLREINCSVVGDCQSAEASECEEPYATGEILSYTDKYVQGGKGGVAKGGGISSAKPLAGSGGAAAKGGSQGMASLKRKIPADISPETKAEIQRIAVEAFKFLDCNGVARIDFLMDGSTGEVWLNEFNTIPGSLSFYLWEPAGLKYADLLDKLVRLALKRQRAEEDIIYSFDTNILSMGGSFGGKGGKGGKV